MTPLPRGDPHTQLPEHVYLHVHVQFQGTICMNSSSNGNIFCVTGHLCGEFTGHRWISHTKSVTRSFDVFIDLRLNKRLSKQSRGWWFGTPSCPLWRHCNVIEFDGGIPYVVGILAATVSWIRLSVTLMMCHINIRLWPNFCPTTFFECKHRN